MKIKPSLLLSSCLGFFLSLSVEAVTNYVDAVNGSDANDGLTAATPKRTLQAAVDAASSGDVVLAAPGFYSEGGRPADYNGEYLANRVLVDKALTLLAAAGPAQTFIVGAPDSSSDDLGPNAVRCVHALSEGTLIAGFTLTNGFTAAGEYADSTGGGAHLGYWDVTLSNCVVAGNAAYSGGGIYYGDVIDCRILNNRAMTEGGGALFSTCHNSVFINNTANRGGGMHAGDLYHCTLVGNSASQSGGGVTWGSLYNSIVYYNDAPQDPNLVTSWGTVTHSCVTPMPPNADETSVITTEPRFANTNGWADLRLTVNSLCINGGNATYTVGATDLDGLPRISGEVPDMGAYEWQGEVLPIVSFRDATSEQIESDGALQIAATLSAPSGTATSFALTFGGTATRGTDYTATPDTLVFEPGVTETNVYVTLIDDTEPEHPETISITLATLATHRARFSTHTVNVLDNDGMPEITQFQINQGAGGTAQRGVQLDVQSTNEPTQYAVSEDASFANATWTALPTEPIAYTLSDGFGEKTVWIKLRKPHGGGYIVSLPAASTIYLGPTLAIAIDQPGATIETGEGGASWFGILDAGALNGSLARSAAPVDGEMEGLSWLSMQVAPARPSRLIFNYENIGDHTYLDFYIDDTYVPTHGWEQGVQTFAHNLEAGSHTLRWEVYRYGGGGHMSPSGYSTLDAVSLEPLPPRVWFLSPTQTVTESVGTVSVDLALEWACDTPVTVSYQLSGDAEPGVDYSVSPANTVTFAPGQTHTNLRVTVINDTEAEHSETATFTLGEGVGYRLGTITEHALTILANDGIIELLQITLAGGATETTNRTVQLRAICSESPSDLLISESSDFTGATWQSYADPVAFTLSDGYGTKTVYVKARLALAGGGWSETDVGSISVTYVACTLQDALDTDIVITSGPNAPWFGQRAVSHDGSDAAQSGPLPPYSYSESIMTATVQGPAKISFWWRIQAHHNSSLTLYVDGVPDSSPLYGATDWTYLTRRIPAGEHTLSWRFYQYYNHYLANCGWVDQLTVQPDWPSATFLSDAQSVEESVGTLLIPIELDRSESAPVVVPFTLGGTATLGTDYTCEPSGSVTFAPGQTSTNLVVTVIDDTLPERAETILITLAPEDGVLAGVIPAHTISIRHNDGAPVIETLTQQNGATWTTNRLVALTLACSGTPTQMRLSEDPLFAGAAWQPFSATPTFMLSEGIGIKTIWAEVRLPLDGGGYVVSDPFSLDLEMRPDLAAALNLTEGQVNSPSPIPWFGQTLVSRDGAAAQSGAIGNNGTTSCSLVLEGEGTIGFWWKVSSELYCDFLRFYVDNTSITSISGTSGDWAYVTYTVTGSGVHTLEWRYTKDYSGYSGSDCGWVDQVDLSGWTFGKVATPAFHPPNGTFFDTTLAVTVTCATADAEIRYTLDGSEPTAASALYTAPITLSATTTIRARAMKVGRADSDLAQATYSKRAVPPTYLPRSGTAFSEPLAITITQDVIGATIRFTTNGADPDVSSQLYTTPVTVTTTTTFRARTFLDGYDPSEVAEATYLLSDVPAALDTGPLVVRHSEDAPWFAQSAITFDGVDAMRSGAIGNWDSSWMEVVLTGPAKVSFRWKASSESNHDWLTFTTNGVQHSSISGQTEWEQVTLVLTQPGDVTLRWTYSKDQSYASGEDAGFLDTLTIIGPHQRIVALTTSDTFVHETDGAREITAVLDEAAPADLHVSYALSGTATSGADYTIAPAAFFFATGETQAVVTVTLKDDTLEELAETLVLTLLPTNDVIIAAPSQHTLTILANDFPQTQPGLIGWWRADHGVATNAAGGVTNWVDRSGYGNVFVQTAENRCPVWLADAVNGKPALRFDLADDGMASGLNIQAPYTVYLVYASQNPSTAARRALQGSNNWGLGPFNGKQRHYANGWVDNASLTAVTGRYEVCTARNTGTASAFWVNGVNRTANAGAVGAPGILHLGGSGACPGEALGGDIVEVLVYDRALSDAELKLPGEALSTAYRIDTAYAPTIITIATHDQTLPEGTRQLTVNGTASGPAETLFWSNCVSGVAGSLSLPPDGVWQTTLPLARGANPFNFWTLHSSTVDLSLTVAGALEPFAVAMNDSGELRLARWWSDIRGFEAWQPLANVMGYGNARALTVGDFDNDGFDDILAFRPSGSRHMVATLFKNDGSNRFMYAASTLVSGYNSSHTMRCAAADFNLDGHLDVAVTGNGNNIPIFLLLGDSKGGFTQQNVPVVNGYGRGLTTADFDHDGYPDLAVSYYSSGALHVLYGRGDGTFEPPVQIGTVSNDPYGLVALDVNQDGHLDLLCRAGGSTPTYLFTGNGNRQFAEGVTVPTLALGRHAGFAAYDFTDDGIPDLLAAAEYDLRFHQGLADGTYTQRTTTAWNYAYGMAATPQPPPAGTPVVRLAADTPVAAVGQAVTITPVVTGATVTGTLWQFGDGGQTAGSPTGAQHAYSAPGRYTVRMTATAANGWKGIGTCGVTVTGAVSTVVGGERLLPESGATNGVWRVAFDRAQILPGAAAETRLVVTPDVHLLDTFESGNADSRWRMPTLPWSVSDVNPVTGSYSLAQTNATVNSCVALLDLPGLRAPYEIRTTFRVIDSTTPQVGIIFERQRTGLGFRYCWLRGGYYDDVFMTLPDGYEARCPARLNLQTNQQHRMTLRVADGLARVWINDTFYGAVPADGLPCVGLSTARSAVQFDEVTVNSLGAEGADLRADITEDLEDGRMTAWRATAGTWSVTTNSPVIGGAYSLRQSNTSIDRAAAIHEGAVIPAGDFLFETDINILGGNGWETALRLGAPEWNTYYEVSLRGRDGTDDLTVYRHIDGSGAQTVVQLKQAVGWLLPPNDSFRLGVARIGTTLQITHNGTVMAVIENEPRVAELCAFGLATYRTDALFDNLRIAAAGRAAAPTFTVGAGTHAFHLAAIHADGQCVTGLVQVTAQSGTPPLVETGGPYTADEAAATNGLWSVALTGGSASDAESGIWQTVWQAETDTFDGNEPDGGKWVFDHNQIVQTNEVIFPSSASSWFFSRTAYPRVEGQSFEGRLRVDSGWAYFGFKHDNEDGSYGQMVHAIEIYNNTFYIRQPGTEFSTGVPYVNGLWYRLRVELKAAGGARYWVRQDDDAAAWLLLYEDYGSAATCSFRKAVTASGAVRLDDVIETNASLTPTLRTSQSGTTPLTLTAINHAGAASTATSTLTCSGNQPPSATFDLSRTLTEANATNGVWSSFFSTAAATDDFGIWKVEWDWAYSMADGFEPSGDRGADMLHTWTQPGTYGVACRITDHARQSIIVPGVVTVAAVQTPTARPGGPYVFDETVSENGAWNVTLSGAASTTPVGAIERYLWDFGADTFSDPLHFPYKYETEPYATVSNGVLHLAQTPSATASGYVYAHTRDTVPRTDGLTAQTRMRACSGTYAVFGFRRPGNDCSLNAFAYSFVFSSGRIYAACNNSWYAGTPYTADIWYDFKIELKQPTGARFYVKTAEASEWTLLYETDVGTDTLFQRGWSKNSTYSAVEIASLQDTVAGVAPSYRLYGQAGDRPVTLTIRNAGTATHSAVATVTCLTNALPIARITPPAVTRDADAASSGQWRIAFSATASTDDRGVLAAEWDFDYNEAAGFRPSGVTSMTPTWTFSGIGERKVALRVRDHLLQPSVVTICPVTLTASGSTPTAVIGVDVPGASQLTAETGWTVRFNGNASTGDVALANFRWDFGDGTTGEGATPLHRYLSAGDYTATLVVTDAAGRDSAAASMPVTVATSTSPTADPGTPTIGGAGGPPVYFNAVHSSDNAAPGVQQGIVSYFWDMDTSTDSDSDGNPANDIDAVGVNPSYTYANAGTYTVRLVVVDGAGQADTNSVTVTVEADRAPQVATPFYQGDPAAPHPVISGVPHLLKGVARDNGTLRHQWIYGDGTSNNVTTVGDRNKIESAHTYTGTPGQTFTATLRVWDAANNVGEASYPIVLVEDTPAARTDLAIDLALWWLHKDQNKSTGQWASMYTDWRGAETVGACINAFQKNGHRLDGNAADNPYVETVRLGYDWLFTKLATVAISGPADSNNNGIGLKTPDGDYPDVTVSRILDTLARAQRHFAMSGTGVAGVKHRHFADLATDLTDTLVARQRTDGTYYGSWSRWDTYRGDTAVGMHAALALRSAQRELGVMIPDSLKAANLSWLNRQVRPDGSFGNTNPYPQGGSDLWSATVGGLHFARLHGFDCTQPFWRNAERWLDDQPWPLSNNDKSYMMLWGLSAVLREATPQPVTALWHSGRDWFDDPAAGLRQKLLAEQDSSGRWYGYHNPGTSGYLHYALSTALAVDMLSGVPVALLPQPVITAPRYWSYGLPLTLTAGLSHHADPSRNIVRYEWDFDGDGTYDFESSDPADTNAVFTLPDPTHGVSDPTTNITVTLRVTDDAATPKQATASVVIQFGDSPFAPFAVAGGPYLGLTNLAVTVDGSGSYDLDNQPDMHAGITLYQWDFTLDGTPDVSTASPTATWSWMTPGTYTIRLRVLDDGLFNNGVSLTSEWAEASVVIVANRQPVAVPGGPYAGEEDAPISFSGAASTDPDPGQTITMYAWDFNGDTIADASSTTPETQWTFDTPGIKTIGLRVQDSEGLWSEWATTQVTVAEVVYVTITSATSPTTGAGSVSDGAMLRRGTSFTATATVTDTERYVFGRWLFNGSTVSYANPYTFAAQNTGTLTAVFDLKRFTVTASVSPVGFGSVSGAGWWNYGVTNTLTATPAAGCAFVEWRDQSTYAVVSTSPSYAFAITDNRALVAIFAEVNSNHAITTETVPPGLAAISGAGSWKNGETAQFVAPYMIVSGENRYLFQRYTRNGSYAAATNIWNWTLTRADPVSATVRAEYVTYALNPRVIDVRRTLDTPVPITTNLVATLVFDRTMDPTVVPTVTFSNFNGTVTRTLPLAGGVWQRINTTTDSYRCPPASFARGEDGTYALVAAAARDPFGSIMTPTNAWIFTVDATPPALPTLRVTASNETSCTVGWQDYVAPEDLNGFRIYVSTAAFTNLADVTPRTFISKSARTYTVSSMALDTNYWVAVVPIDRAGNTETIVDPIVLRLPSAVPPPVTLAVTAPSADAALLNWNGYAGNSFGFAGFRVYTATAPFDNVAGMTPITTLSKVTRTYTASGLDRSVTHWFAVVGYNTRGEFVPDVTARAWSDPYQGEITQNLTLGTPGSTTDILGTLTVRNGATLTIPAGTTLSFRQGAGIVVENGALVANGTALAPIRFTAANPDGRVLQAGDWSGITLGAGAGTSLLRHVWIEYGSGLTVEGCAPTIDACSAQYNAPAALRARAGATLRTSDALLLYNAVALLAEADATVVVARSIVRNNQTNALAAAGSQMTATNVWWGAADLATVQSNHAGTIVCEPILTAEPVLTPAADAHDGNRNVGVPNITLALAARVAEAVQISEDSLFTGSFFDPFTTPKNVALSAGGGIKTLYIRFRNAAGQISDTVTLPVTYITGGPQITACNIAEGAVLTRPFRLTASASSGLGVVSLRALVDEAVIAETNAASLNARWDVRTLTPGTHRVRLEALDTRGNLGTRAFNVTANIQPPPNPVLTAPQDGLLTTEATVVASGTAEPFATVALRRNGAVVQQVTAAQNGAFSATVPLAEGENIIAAWVTDDFGSGRSNERRVTRDSGAPEPVTLSTPSYKQGTGLQFEWFFAPEGEQPVRVALLRSAEPFTVASGATWQGTWTTANPLTHTPPSDGRWYFAMIGRDAAYNVSLISNVITNDFDGTPPVFTNAFNKPSPCGTGPLQIEIESSEPLSGLPIVTVQPPAASGPTMLTVSNTAPNRYTSVYNVQSVAGSGPLAIKVSGTDFAGNRATSVTPAGPVVILDTRAPAGLLSTVPAGLIQVTNPVLMQVSMMLDEMPADTPQLRFTPPEGATLPITLTGGGTNWSGTIELLPSMGSGVANFTLAVSDILGNAGTQLGGAAQVELYNTAAPEPPPSVADLRASTDQKGGVIKLAWLAVPTAESYSLYRQAGITGTMPDTLLAAGITAATYEDLPPEDGFFRYMVRSVRRGSMADPSPVALGISDRTPPPTPQNLTAALSSSGVRVEWEYATSGEQPARFRVYRNGVLLRDRLSANTRYILDNPPKGTWTYSVAAADINLNEALSNEASIDMTLPGVVRTDVIVGIDRIPRITWQMRTEHVGVNLYRNGVKLNATPLTGTSYTDYGLSGNAVTRYEVRGVSSGGAESAARQLPVYHAGFALAVNPEVGGHALLRYFDQCVVTVSNLTGDATLDVAQLELTRAIAGGTSLTRTVTSAQSAMPGGTAQLAVTYPCATETGLQNYTGVLLQALDDASASVRYEVAFDGGTPSLAQAQVGITIEQQPVAGAACAPQVRFYNRSQVPIDLVMWRNGQPGDVAIRVLDANETEVNRIDVMMPKASLIATPDGQRGFVRIPASSSTLMSLPEIIVPEALGEQAQASIEVTAAFVYTACGTAGEELSGPLQARLAITPRPTPYTAFGLPERSAYRAGETLVVTGYAFERATGLPMTNAPVCAGIGLDGFAWHVNAVSDSHGCFRAEWPIVHGISGLCQVWGAHPDVRDRLNHGQTAIYQAYFRPPEGNVRMAANDILTLRLNAYNPGSFTFTNLTAAFTAWQITDGVTNLLPMSVVSGVVENVEGLGLPPKQLTPVTLKLFAAEEALPAFNCRYELVTPEGLRIPFDARVSVTKPLPLITVASPANGYVDMSLDRGKTRSTDVELRNDGFKPLLGVKMTAPTIPWMHVALTPQSDGAFALPDLAPGQSFTFQVLYAPGEDVEMKYYSDALTITGTNSVTPKVLNLYAKVTSERSGGLSFHIANNLGQVVPDASIRVRSALDGTERTGFKSDANGDVVISDLMEGRWHWQVSAAGHATQAGTLQVEADLETSVEPILTRELVTVTFTVVPVPFTDRYEIKIEQTFSTYVPAPVLVVDPIYSNLGRRTEPFEYTFTATAKNHGLIKLTEFTAKGAQSATASMTPAISYLPVLEPMEQIEIPYTVSYWGTQDAPPAPAPGPLAVPEPAFGPLAALGDATSSGRGAGLLNPPPPRYDPCTDDFMEAVVNLMSYLNGRYGSISGTALMWLQAWLNVIWEAADSDAVPIGIGDMATMYQTFLCMGELLGTSSSGEKGSGGGGGGGGGGGYGGAGGGCFVAGTPVLMADGTSRAIEAVKPGDVVRTGPRKKDVARVTETYKRPEVAIHQITLDNGTTLNTTAEHRIWTDAHGWMLAKDIQVGDRVVCTNDTTATVTASIPLPQSVTVYTFELREDIAYYAHGVLVRHLCGMQFPRMTPTHGTPSRTKGGAQ